jgi:hypothetical protein
MVRNNHTSIGLVAAKYHVASVLPAEDKTSLFERCPHLAPRQVGRKL